MLNYKCWKFTKCLQVLQGKYKQVGKVVKEMGKLGRNTVNKIKTEFIKRKFKITLSLTALIVVVLLSMGAYQAGLGSKVIFNGQDLGIVKEEEHFQEVLHTVSEEVKESKGEGVTFDRDYSFERVRVLKEDITSAKDLKSAIYKNINLKSLASIIKVNDKEVVALKTKKEAQNILEEIKKPYSSKKDNVEIKEVSFVDKVEIIEKEIPLENLVSKEEALEYLNKGTDEVKEYEVAKGDTSWDISRAFDVGVREIEKANPDSDLEDLHPGDKINLTVPKPFIDVKSIQEVTLNEKIPFETEYKDDKNMYKGQKKVITEGKNGTKELRVEITLENGIEVNKDTLSEEVIKEPTTQVVAKGTKEKPKGVGSGRFQRPASGRTGNMGLFGAPRDGGARRHSGIDITNGTGTPIYASDNGKVTSYIGYRGGYGYIVELSHGNGYSTRYAHLSKILVKAGQTVGKGQQIAKMGNTGHSTGPHLHFEIRKGGTPQNPFKYISR